MSIVGNITYVIGNLYFVFNSVFTFDFKEDYRAEAIYIITGIYPSIVQFFKVLYENAVCAEATAEVKMFSILYQTL